MFKLLKEKLGLLKQKAAESESKEKQEVFTESIMAQRIRKGKLDELFWELELGLLESDVAYPVVEAIKTQLKEELIGRKVKLSVKVSEVLELALRNAITKVLTTSQIDFDRFIAEGKKPIVLMSVGVNGTGKTTAIAKIGYRLLKNNKSCVIAASDTFRAGAIEQLERHSEKLGVKLIKHHAGSDPAAVAYDAIEHAKARGKDVVLIDTAGRMQTNQNLMDEMKKIKRVANPNLIIFVGDALAGNDAVEQAKTFESEIGIDFAILTKIDADAKGGAALSIAYAVGKPILFVGTGQKYEDLEKFDANWMVNRLFEK